MKLLNKSSWKNVSKKSGFTLAEVLITLGIIGIIAALTLPGLISNYQYLVLQVQFKKAYSELNQIATLFKEHNGVAIPTYINKYGYNSFLEQFPKYLKETSKISDWQYNSDSSIINMPYEMYTMNGKKMSSFLCDTHYFHAEITERIVSFDDTPKKGYNGPRVCVDVNGTKKPNILGVDIFYFQFTTDGYAIPEGTEHKDNNYTASVYSGGTAKGTPENCYNQGTYSISCPYYALIDKNPKGNGKYWKDFIGKKQYK